MVLIGTMASGSTRAGRYALPCDLVLAARLYGAAEAQRERIGHHSEPGEDMPIERAREALGAIAFAAAESDGRSLSYDEAIAQARAWLDESS